MPDLRRLTSWGWKHMREIYTTTHREEEWAMGSERQDGGCSGRLSHMTEKYQVNSVPDGEC